MSDRAPDHIEPSTGWRSWIVGSAPGGPLLRSVVRRADWTPRRPLEARCAERHDGRRNGRWILAHDAPAMHCGCGHHGEEARRALERVAAGLGRYGVPVEVLDCRGRSIAEALGLGEARPRRHAATAVTWTPRCLRRT